MSTERYVELFRLHERQNKAFRNYRARGQEFARALADAVQEYLGLPSTYQTLDGETKRWVCLGIPVRDGFREVDHHRKLDDWGDDGGLEFAIGVNIASGLNSFPKTRYWYLYNVYPPFRESGLLRLHALGADGREYTFSEDQDLEPVCAALCNRLVGSLYETPEDTFGGVPQE